MRRALLALFCLCPAVGAVAGEEVRLLCGFEQADAVRWGAKRDGDQLTWQVSQYRKLWFRKGDVTQGEWALVARRGPIGKDTHYNVLRRLAVLNSYGWFRKRLPADWSGCDRLRLDVKSAGSAGRVRIDLEDELCQPQVRRTFAVPRDKWVTLEFDLAGASAPHEIALPAPEAERLGVKTFKGRVLNLARMANIEVYFEQLDAKSLIHLDNLRLLRPGANEKTPHPVVRDATPFPAPQPLPAEPPEPPKRPPGFVPLAGAPEQTAIRTLDLSQAPKTGYPRVGRITGRAFVAADRRRILLGFLAGYLHVVQTADGGATWTGLDGAPRPTRCYHNANAPSHAAVAAGPDMLYLYTDHCSGGGNPSNLFFRLIRFTGAGWSLGPPHLADIDCRHCPEWKVRTLRLPSGRIWAAWMHLDRFGRIAVRARYSDDAGRTWRDPDSNAMRLIERDDSQGTQRYGVTLWADEPKELTPPVERANGRVGAMYAHGGLVLVPYGEHVACIWAQTWHPKTVWSAFDGRRWGPAKPVGRGSPVSAITLGDKTVYLVLQFKKTARLLRLDGDKWVDDAPPEGRPGVLSAAGDTLLNFWTKQDGAKAALYVASRAKNGRWGKPRLIAKETLPGTGPRIRLRMTVPTAARGPFIPLAWGPHREWIRFTRLPLK